MPLRLFTMHSAQKSVHSFLPPCLLEHLSSNGIPAHAYCIAYATSRFVHVYNTCWQRRACLALRNVHCIQTTPTCIHQSVRCLYSICMQRILVTSHLFCKGSYAPQMQLLSTCTHMLSSLPQCFNIMSGDRYPNVTGMSIMVHNFKTVTRTCYTSTLMRYTQKSAQKV